MGLYLLTKKKITLLKNLSVPQTLNVRHIMDKINKKIIEWVSFKFLVLSLSGWRCC